MQIKYLGPVDYHTAWQQMRAYVDAADAYSEEQIWVTEHPSVFTLGQSGREEHLLSPGDITVIRTDRGGQVTYHGPGQLILYPLLHLERHALTARKLVTWLEKSVIETLASYGIQSTTRPKAPGIYVGDTKIGSIGLRIRHGWSYHGLSLNVEMDLEPFTRINPCGYAGLQMTDMREHCSKPLRMQTIAEALIENLKKNL